MTNAHLAGLAILAVWFMVAGFFAFRGQPRGIKLFAVALALVGLGYLATTPAPSEIAGLVFGAFPGLIK